MPLDVLGDTRATMIGSTGFLLARKGMGNPFNTNRDGARCLQLFIFNEESLVCACHQRAQNASLPFVHTARRSYRLVGPTRVQEVLHSLTFGLALQDQIYSNLIDQRKLKS